MRTCSGDRPRGYGRPMDDTCMQLRSTNGQMWATNGATIDRKHLHGDSRATHGTHASGCPSKLISYMGIAKNFVFQIHYVPAHAFASSEKIN